MQKRYGRRVSATQLAIRFNERQMRTLETLAAERHLTRSAVVRELVDQAEKSRIIALYTSAYESTTDDVDQFGDLGAFHYEAESARVAARSGDTTW